MHACLTSTFHAELNEATCSGGMHEHETRYLPITHVLGHISCILLQLTT